jgi:hypothetical protein
MANVFRDARNYFETVLTNPVAINELAIVAAGIADLPAYNAAADSRYLPLIIHNIAIPAYEIVWVTNHNVGSTSATVLRGQEGTAARDWDAGTKVSMGPSVRDLALLSLAAGLPADAHLGQRIPVTDKGYVLERARSGNEWAPSVGVALADWVGPRRGGTNPPSDAVITKRSGFISTLCDASGRVAVVYRQPFPTATIGVQITSAAGTGPGGAVTFYSVPVESAAGFTSQAWRVDAVAGAYATTPIGAITSIFYYDATGY